jgi:hypothetical protein
MLPCVLAPVAAGNRPGCCSHGERLPARAQGIASPGGLVVSGNLAADGGPLFKCTDRCPSIGCQARSRLCAARRVLREQVFPSPVRGS